MTKSKKQKMKYLKHYWIDINTGLYANKHNPIEKRHPELEFPGLDVKFWLIDENGIDICLSSVPNETELSDISDSENNKVVQVLTEEQFNSISVLLQESHTLFSQAIQESDEELKLELEQQSDLKIQEAKQLFSS